MAETVTWTASQQNYENGVQYTSATVDSNISLSFGDGTNDGKYYTTGSGIRIYSSGKVTVSTSSSYQISSIVITYSGTGYTGTFSANVGSYSLNNTTGSWTGNAQSVILTNTASSGHARIQKVAVTYAATGAPTISSLVVSGTPTNTTYIDGDSFDPAGLTVTATYSNASQNVISDGIAWSITPSHLTLGTTSVSVVATVGNVSSVAYTVNGLTVNPIPEKTIAEFIASEGGKCYLTGIVSNIANTTYGNFDFTDESGTIYVFGCLTSEGESRQFESLDVVEGDKIKVLAEAYEYYRGTTHEAKDVIFVEELAIEKPQYTVTIATPENGSLVVKNGETTLASGDQVEEGETITIECTPTDAETYRYKNWQYKEDGDWVTMTSTMTRVVTKNIAIRANFELIPVYTVAWSVNGAIVKTDDLKEGAAVTAPANPEAINGKVFTGWIETATVEGATPAYVTPATTAAENVTYYAVFADATAGGASQENVITYNTENIPTTYAASADVVLNGMTFNVTQMYKNGEKMQWRAAGNSNGTGAMYNKTAITGIQSIAITYAGDTNKNFTVKVGSSTNPTSGTEIAAEQDGETDTYVYDCSSIAPDYFVLTNGLGAGYLSSIVITYGGGSLYSNFSTIVAEPLPAHGTLNFVATNEEGYWATFSSTEDVIFDANDVIVYTATVDGDALVLLDADDNSLSCVTDKAKNEGWVAGYYVQANTGVLINSIDESVSYYYIDTDPYTPNQLTEIETDPEYNMLRPASVAMTGDFKFYKLAYDDFEAKTGLGFYYGAAEGAAFTAKAGGAYLAVPTSLAGVSIRYIINGEQTATAVENIEANENVLKMVENGQVIIIKNGVRYNALGQMVK